MPQLDRHVNDDEDSVDTLDDMDPDERDALLACLDESFAEVENGVPGITIEALMTEFKARHP